MQVHPETCNCKKCKQLNKIYKNNKKHSTKQASGAFLGLIIILLAVL